MLRFRLTHVLAVIPFCWLLPAMAETDSPPAPLVAKKPQHAEFEHWRSLLKSWRDRRDQLRSARVKVRGEEQSIFTEQLATGAIETRILRKRFTLEGQLNLKSQTLGWTDTHFESRNELHARLMQQERVRFWLRNGVPSAVSRPLRVWSPQTEVPRSLLYWNPLYSGFNEYRLAGKHIASIRDPGIWYRLSRNHGIKRSDDTITISQDAATGLLQVRLKNNAPINGKAGIRINEFCFNERQGFTLLSHKFWIYPATEKQPAHPFREVTLNWEQVDSVWVPTAVTTAYSGGRHLICLELEWSEFNTRLKEDPPLDWSKIDLL